MNRHLIGKFLVLFFLGCVVGGNPLLAGVKNEPDRIIIGCIQDLTDPSSSWGPALRKGAELAVERINAAGGIDGRTVELKTYDVKNDPLECLNLYIRLVDQDKAVAVIGPPLGAAGLALANLSYAKRVPILVGFPDSRALERRDGSAQPYMFLAQPTGARIAEAFADLGLAKLGMKTAVLIYDQTNPFLAAQAKAFLGFWEKNGGKVLAELQYKAGDKDFRGQLAKIKAGGADCLFAPLSAKELAVFLQQANEEGIKLAVFGGLAFAPPFAAMFPDFKAADQLYFADVCSEEEPQLREIREAYKGKFNEAPVSKAFLGFDAVSLIADVIKRAKAADPQSVREGLEQVKDFPGLTGNITLSSKTHQTVGFSLAFSVFEQGKPQDLGRFLPESQKK